MMMKRTLTSLAALVVITACATPGRVVERQEPFTREPVGEESIRVHIQNNNFMDARLYAVGLGSRHYLGVVGGKQQVALEVPWDFSQPLRIEIDMLAGPKCTTRTLEVDPGDILDLRIESVFSKSRDCSQT